MDEPTKEMTPKWYVLGPLVAMAGGIFGILAAAYEEAGYGMYIGAFVAAPVFEELIKPCGVYWLLGRKPHVLPSQRYIAFLSALAGLSFGIIESLMYVGIVYLVCDELDQGFVIWRFTVCLLLHAGCSFIVGHGINHKLVAWVRGEISFIRIDWKFFLIAMLIHSAYNISVTFVDLFPDCESALVLIGFI